MRAREKSPYKHTQLLVGFTVTQVWCWCLSPVTQFNTKHVILSFIPLALRTASTHWDMDAWVESVPQGYCPHVDSKLAGCPLGGGACLIDTGNCFECEKPSSIAFLDPNRCAWHLLPYPVERNLNIWVLLIYLIVSTPSSTQILLLFALECQMRVCTFQMISFIAQSSTAKGFEMTSISIWSVSVQFRSIQKEVKLSRESGLGGLESSISFWMTWIWIEQTWVPSLLESPGLAERESWTEQDRKRQSEREREWVCIVCEAPQPPETQGLYLV